MRRYLFVVAVVVAVAVYAVVSVLQFSSAQIILPVAKLYLQPINVSIPVVNVYGYYKLYKGLYADSSNALIMSNKGIVAVNYNTGEVSEWGLPSDFTVTVNSSRLYDMIGSSTLIAVYGSKLCGWVWVGYWGSASCMDTGVENPTIIDGANYYESYTVCVANSTYAWCYKSLGLTAYAYSLNNTYRPVVITDSHDAYAVLIGGAMAYFKGTENDVSTKVIYQVLGYPNIVSTKIASFEHLIAKGRSGGWASVLYMDTLSGSYFFRFTYDGSVGAIVTDVKYYPMAIEYDKYIDSPIVTVNNSYYALLTGFKGSDLIITVVNLSANFDIVGVYVLPNVNSASYAMSEDGSSIVLVVDTPNLGFASVAPTVLIPYETKTTTVTATVAQVVPTATTTTTVTKYVPYTTTILSTVTMLSPASTITTTVTVPTTVTTTYTTAVPTTVTVTSQIPTTVTTTVGGSTTVTTTYYTTTEVRSTSVPRTVTTAYTTTIVTTTVIYSYTTVTKTMPWRITYTTSVPVSTVTTTITTVINSTTTVLPTAVVYYTPVTYVEEYHGVYAELPAHEVTVVQFAPFPVTTTEYVTTTTTVTKCFTFSYDVVFAIVAVALIATAMIALLKHKHH